MRIKLSMIAGLALLAVAGLVALPSAAVAQDWNWGVTPYVWLPGAGLDIKVNDSTLVSGRASLSDLADDVDFVAQLHLEGQKDAFGMLFDVNYVNMGGHQTRPPFDVRTDLKLTIIEGAGVWNPSGNAEGFGIIFGARVFNIAQKLDLTAPAGFHENYGTSPTLLDGMIGFRYLASFGERASFNVRGDYSAGGTESSMNGLVGFGYAFDDAKKYTLLAGYRYMDIQFKEKDQNAEVESELTLDGPYVGFRFGF